VIHAIPIRRHLGDVGILAEPAFEVAAYCGDGKRPAAGHQVENRLFLNGVVAGSDQAPVNPCFQNTIPIFPYPADSPFAVADNAIVVAQPTSDPLILHGIVQPGFHGKGSFNCLTATLRQWAPATRK
jgi:hypothetical protein